VYLVSTSSNWNVGDDLIREGVFRILGLSPWETTMWLNRCQVIYPKSRRGWTALWKVLRNQPGLKDIIPHAKAFILAGTPERLHTLEEVYELCLKHSTPIWLIGVGMPQPGHRLLKKCRRRGLVSRASVRDDLATETLKKAGIQHEWFLDPAFHAQYDAAREKSLDVFLTYKMNPSEPSADTAYLETYRRFADRIDMVVVHHPDEYPHARELFGTEVYYSSDYQDLKDLYASCRCLITNRIHSAAPALRNGAEVHFFHSIKKHRMVEIWSEKLLEAVSPDPIPLHLYGFEEWDRIELDQAYDWKRLEQYFLEDLEAHSGFVRMHVKRDKET